MNQDRPIRILLADDQQLLVRALSTILDAEPDLEVVATANDGIGTLAQLDRFTIDVAVLDIRMPRLDGIEACRKLKSRTKTPPDVQPASSAKMSRSPTPAARCIPTNSAPEQRHAARLRRPRVIHLTTFNDPALLRGALDAGSDGFLLKDSDPDELAGAIRAVHRGESVLSSGASGHLISAYREAITRQGPGLSPQVAAGLATITPRELEVLHELSTGASNAEIAEKLFIGEATVKTHVSSLLAKLQARDRVALVVFAYRSGLAM